MTDDAAKDQEYLTGIARRHGHVARVTQNCGPEVVKALNDSVPFLEDYFLAKGVVADVPYVPSNKQGNQRYTANSADPEVIAALQRRAIANARYEALHVPSLAEEQQMAAVSHFLAHKNIALAKALGSPPIPRFPPPKLTRSMTEARLKDLGVRAAEGLIDTSKIEVSPRPGSLKKLRSFLIRFPTKGELVVLDAIEFDGLSLYASAVAISHPAKKPLPLLLFMATSPASDFAWPADMPTETRIACSLKVVAAFAADRLTIGFPSSTSAWRSPPPTPPPPTPPPPTPPPPTPPPPTPPPPTPPPLTRPPSTTTVRARCAGSPIPPVPRPNVPSAAPMATGPTI